jgi:hypothetical protein
MGALKGRFQCLRGLRVMINNTDDHREACRWITIAIIIHNMIVELEGISSTTHFHDLHGHPEEHEDSGEDLVFMGTDEEKGEAKRQRLTAELLAGYGEHGAEILRVS